jgi:hypothetical protein
MLNRTNRTLSANTNRLNLGTRKLDQNASANNGSLTLRTAHHPFTVVTVRTGAVEYPGIPMEGPPIKVEPKSMKPEMPAMSGSSPRSSRPARGFWAWDQGQSAMSSQLAQPALVLRDVAGTGRGVAPRVSPSRSHTSSSLAWHCDRTRRAGRSARAALALVTGAAPIT